MSWSISIVATDVQSAIQTIERGERGAHGIPKEAENALIAALKTMPQKRALFIEGSGYRDELLHWGSFTLTIKPVEIAEAHDAHALHGREW